MRALHWNLTQRVSGHNLPPRPGSTGSAALNGGNSDQNYKEGYPSTWTSWARAQQLVAFMSDLNSLDARDSLTAPALCRGHRDVFRHGFITQPHPRSDKYRLGMGKTRTCRG